jgi:hypothetical protein
MGIVASLMVVDQVDVGSGVRIFVVAENQAPPLKERATSAQLRVPVAAAFHGLDERLELSIRLALGRSQGIDHLHALEDQLSDGGDLAIVFRDAAFEFGGHG